MARVPSIFVESSTIERCVRFLDERYARLASGDIQALERDAARSLIADILLSIVDSGDMQACLRARLLEDYIRHISGSVCSSAEENMLVAFLVADMEQLGEQFVQSVCNKMCSQDEADARWTAISLGDSLAILTKLLIAVNERGGLAIPWLPRLFEQVSQLCATADHDIRARAAQALPFIVEADIQHDPQAALRGLGKHTHAWCAHAIDVGKRLLCRGPTALLGEYCQFHARMMDFYEQCAEHALIDVRADDDLLAAIQLALGVRDKLAQKYALYVLKRLVSWTVKHPDLAPDTLSHRFTGMHTPQSQDAWKDYFLVYAAVSDTSGHLIEPLLPKIGQGIVQGTLHVSWWAALLRCGFHNESIVLRKRIVTYILGASVDTVSVLMDDKETCSNFLLQALMDVVGYSPFYATKGSGAQVSVFGELLSSFWYTCLCVRPEFEGPLLNAVVGAKGFLPIVYSLQGIVLRREANPPRAGSEGMLEALTKIAQRKELCSRYSRVLVRRLVLRILAQLSSFSELSYTKFKQLLAVLSHLADQDEDTDKQLLRRVSQSIAASDTDRIWLQEQALSDLQRYCHSAPKVTSYLNATLLEATTVTASQALLELFSTTYRIILAAGDAACLQTCQMLCENYFATSNLASTARTAHQLVLYDALLASGCPISSNNELLQALADWQPSRPDKYADRWSDTASMLAGVQWRVIGRLIEGTKAVSSKLVAHIYNRCIAVIEAGHQGYAIPAMQCLATINRVASGIVTPTLMAKAADAVWSAVREAAPSPKRLRVLMGAMLDLVYAPAAILLQQGDGAIIRDINAKVLAMSEHKPFVMARVVERFFRTWQPLDAACLASMEAFASDIQCWLTYGPSRDKEEQDMDAALARKLQDEAHMDECAADADSSQNDYLVRVYTNSLLMRLNRDNASHTAFARCMFDRLVTQLMDKSLHPSIEFTNQPVNRTKVRLMSALLVLSRFMSAEQCVTTANRMLHLLGIEINNSTRFYAEWILCRAVLAAYSDTNDLLWTALQQQSPKPMTTSSLLTVCRSIMAALEGNHDALRIHATKVFEHALPWLCSNHFTIRLYAQWLFMQAWTKCSQTPSLADLQTPQLKSFASFLASNQDVQKFQKRYQESSYYMSQFHPHLDLNIAFLFLEFPTLSDIADDERISPRAFRRVNGDALLELPYRAEERVFYRQQAGAEDDSIGADSADHTPQATAVVQRKIDPWEDMLQVGADISRQSVRQQLQGHQRSELIVCASLVERVPNLGGLCRTCEIFNASALTVHSLRCKDDMQFKNVAVASDRWMPLIEVRRENVRAWLLQQKAAGYKVVAVEQTVNSVRLGDPSFKFGSKVVLLLGEEKAGLPADLLQIADCAVEIPQLGFTRSLNVHVSGALLVWEYTRERLAELS
ncbi:hypothetical protein RI367_004721 [Sorochytrium milnesiophthora]